MGPMKAKGRPNGGLGAKPLEKGPFGPFWKPDLLSPFGRAIGNTYIALLKFARTNRVLHENEAKEAKIAKFLEPERTEIVQGQLPVFASGMPSLMSALLSRTQAWRLNALQAAKHIAGNVFEIINGYLRWQVARGK